MVLPHRTCIGKAFVGVARVETAIIKRALVKRTFVVAFLCCHKKETGHHIYDYAVLDYLCFVCEEYHLCDYKIFLGRLNCVDICSNDFD